MSYLITNNQSNFAFVQNFSVETERFIRNNKNGSGNSQTLLGNEIH